MTIVVELSKTYQSGIPWYRWQPCLAQSLKALTHTIIGVSALG